MPVIELRRRKLLNDESTYLARFKNDVTSQCGEDGVIEEIFNIIGTESRWCVEFGAWDGKYLSNTYNLIANKGWSGTLIEGSRQRFGQLEQTYAGNPKAHLICDVVGFDPNRDSLDCILARTPIPERFDLLSIDIDGNDWYIWESVTRFRPRIVVIEFNPTVPNDVAFLQDKDPAINQGCSLLALLDLAKSKDYELVCATAWNGFFVVKEEFHKFNIADNSIDAMYLPVCDGRVFHGFDCRIFAVGMPRFLWREVMIPYDGLQFLPKEQLGYGGRLPQAAASAPAADAQPSAAALGALAAQLAAEGRGEDAVSPYHQAAAAIVKALRPDLTIKHFRLTGRTVALNGCRIPEAPRPGRPMALFLAGLGSDLAASCQTALALADLFDLAVIDLPGYGITAPLAKPTLAALADEVVALFEQGSITGPVPFAFGESLGGLVALELARRTGQIGNVVLLDTPFRGGLPVFKAQAAANPFIVQNEALRAMGRLVLGVDAATRKTVHTDAYHDLVAGAAFGCMLIPGERRPGPLGPSYVDDEDIARLRQVNPNVVIVPRVVGATHTVLRDQPDACRALLAKALLRQ